MWDGWPKAWEDSVTICKLPKREKSNGISGVFTEIPRRREDKRKEREKE